MSPKIPVKFYFDIVSPYSYLGFELISRYQPRWARMQLQLKPVHLFAVLHASENRPPMASNVKGR